LKRRVYAVVVCSVGDFSFHRRREIETARVIFAVLATCRVAGLALQTSRVLRR